MADAADQSVTLAQDGDVAVITFDDGGVNAMSYAFLTQAQAAFAEAQGSKSIVIAGNHKCLSAGFDLTEVVKGPAERDAIIGAGGELFMEIFTCPKPVVVACTGHAMAGGVVYLLTGDQRVGRAGNYKISFNEVLIGVPLPVLGIRLTQYRVNPAMAERVVLGEVFDPAGAMSIGLLDALIDGDENDVIADAVGRAQFLAQVPAEAYAQSKLEARRDVIARS